MSHARFEKEWQSVQYHDTLGGKEIHAGDLLHRESSLILSWSVEQFTEFLMHSGSSCMSQLESPLPRSL